MPYPEGSYTGEVVENVPELVYVCGRAYVSSLAVEGHPYGLHRAIGHDLLVVWTVAHTSELT